MILPTQDDRITDCRDPGQPLSGLDAWVNRWVGVYRRRSAIQADLRLEAERIDADARRWIELSDAELQARLGEISQSFRRAPDGTDARVREALAALREAADRRLGLRPFVVQLMGALALHRGYLAEMATGEGKTLTAGLAAVLAGWTQRPCHLVTANDYLVQRDAEWLRPLYQFCGVRVGYVTSEMGSEDRRKAYACQVTYTTSKEIVADFLRDRLRLGRWTHPSRRQVARLLNPGGARQFDVVMRGLHTAIVDEADSLLIDEAITPLIISASHKNEMLRQACQVAQAIAAQLEAGIDYTADPRYREIEFTPRGRQHVVEHGQSLPSLFRQLGRRQEILKQALVARDFYHNGKQYAVVDGKVAIVDEFTGRILPHRTWRAGLHQAIEAKEGLTITDPTETMARLSFQRFFRMFHRLSGMTGTAAEAASELWHIYRLPVVRIPTNRPCQRRMAEDRIFPSLEAKWEAIVESVSRVHAANRPVLVGTRSIAASEHLAERLAERGLGFRVLNALRHAEEAEIVAEAGQPGRITIATNMAGRGTDIRLGQGVAEAGGLHVIATERHESHRIDRQLFGRAARQGDPGTAQCFVSLEDELLRRYLPPRVLRWFEDGLRAGLPGARRWGILAVELAQRRAQRQAFRQRSAVLRTDGWLDDALSFAGA